MAGYPETAGLPCPSCGAQNNPLSTACVSCGASLAAVPRVRPGMVLGRRYEIQRVLGGGGMGMVFEAHDRELDETVAVKVLRANLASSEDMARRFRTEIKLARRVRHRNVCGIHEYGSDGAFSFIAMELIRGTDLKHLIKQEGALAIERAFEVCIQIAEGLQAIHEAGIIHRDLKTSNVMLDSTGRVLLMDFGIAKDTQQGVGLGATAVGQLIGTPEYMSPEQARGQPLDTRSDLYALGIIVFEVFSGHVPFQGTTPIATLFKNLEEPPPLEGEAAAGIPRPVVPVLARALAKQPADRFQSAREMAEALRQVRTEVLGPGHTPVLQAGTPDPSTTLTLSPSGPATPQVTLPASGPTAVPPPTAVPAGAPAAAPPRAVGSARARSVPEPPAVTVPARAVPTPLLPLRSARPGSVWRQGVSPAAVAGGAGILVLGVVLAGWLALSLLGLDGIGPSGEPDIAPPTPLASPSAWPRATVVPGPTPTVPPRPSRRPTPQGHVTPLPSSPEPTPAAPSPLSSAPVEPEPASAPAPTAEASASLQVRVRPWADVSVDGEVVGTTPFAPLTLSPGPHDLEFVHPDFKPVRRRITLKAGETLRVELDMTLDAVPK